MLKSVEDMKPIVPDTPDERSGDLTIGVSKASLVPLVVMALLFGVLAVAGVSRKGEEMWGSGWIMRVALVSLALPGPLCVLALGLALRVRLRLSSEGMAFQGPLRRWSVAWTEVRDIKVHHFIHTGMAIPDLVSPPPVTVLPVGAVEFGTAGGRVVLRSMQMFRLALEIEPLLHHIKTRWRARTGGEALNVSHVRMTARDSWTLR